MKRALLVAAAVAAVAFAGCLDPFRAHVDPSVLRGDVVWTVTTGHQEDNGWLGPNKVDMQYRHVSSSPPFTGDLVVLSLRQAGGYTTEDLVDIGRRLLAASAENNFTLDPSQTAQGERTLRNGLHTHWFTEQGTVPHDSQVILFTENAKVRLVAEVGYDGLSGTAFIAIGTAQIESNQCPLVGPCTPQRDLRTWESLVGDARGSIGGAKNSSGLLYNLVTHD